MKRILNVEIKRSFRNKFFILSICISMVLVLWFAVERIPFCIQENEYNLANSTGEIFFEVSFLNFICSENLYIQQKLFYVLIPVLATISYGGSFYTDINSGFIEHIGVRVKKTHFLISKYISTFICSGVSIILPAVMSFIISAAFLPSMKPEVSYIFTNITSEYKWSEILFTNPYLYIFINFVLLFLYSGFIGCMGLTVSYFSSKYFLPIIFPLIFHIATSLVFELTGLVGFSPRNVIVTLSEETTTFSVFAVLLMLFVLSFFPYFLIGIKRSIFDYEK